MIINAHLIRKAEELQPEQLTVSAVVELPHAEFEDLLENPNKNRDYIAERQDLMGFDPATAGPKYRAHEICHRRLAGGVLIDGQGYDYPRYAAFLPGARASVEQALTLDRLDPDCVQRLCDEPETTMGGQSM